MPQSRLPTRDQPVIRHRGLHALQSHPHFAQLLLPCRGSRQYSPGISTAAFSEDQEAFLLGPSRQYLQSLDAQVIIPAPYWTTYPSLAELAGAKPVIVETTLENEFLMTSQQLREAITPASRILILCTPSNPTGAVYSLERLQVTI